MKTFAKASLTASLMALAASAEKYKFGVMTDIHLQPNYLPNRPYKNH